MTYCRCERCVERRKHEIADAYAKIIAERVSAPDPQPAPAQPCDNVPALRQCLYSDSGPGEIPVRCGNMTTLRNGRAPCCEKHQPVQPCDNCGGSGTYIRDMSVLGEDFEPCPACHGSGVQPCAGEVR